ncbi:PAS domain S-box protein [Gramella sp. AN32]|uniref:histidine kinase n=1 Tax=Christiangramia antarctica TaxID=2058158 RepID=A0ABW5X8S9_9FLAO|nr:PAS domain S-box protein [Gramella sp. AN32]MCM4155359.1 histidine kinase [Gramella sp. AN32]
MANNNVKSSHNVFSRRPVITAVLIFLFLLIIGFFILWQRYQILIEQRLNEMSVITEVVEQNIAQTLKTGSSAALSLALQIDDNGDIKNFEEVASQLVDNNPNLDGVETVPDGIIKQVYPYEENKDAINYNILEDPDKRGEALKAIQEKKMFFAGPFELRQGGLAIIGRLPVFIKNEFWGFSAVIIHFDNLIENSGIKELGNGKYDFQFSKLHPVTGEEEFFLERSDNLDLSYSETINLPDGEWNIYVIPTKPQEPFNVLLPVAILIALFSGLFGWFIYYVLRQPGILSQKVKEQSGKLAQSELRFRTIFNQAAIGMMRVDSKTGMILEANQQCKDLLGYSDEELIKLDYRAVSHPEDTGTNTSMMEKLRNNEIREYSLQKRLIRKNGKYLWVNLNVSALWPKGEEATSHIAIIEDISAQIAAKQKLIENEKRFRSLVENSNEIILIINVQGEAIYFTPSLKRITGYDSLSLSGADIFSMIHPQEKESVLEKFMEANENPGTPITDVVMRMKTKFDNYIWVNATITNLLNEKSIDGYVVNLRDVTGKMEAEINLNKSYDFVMEQNKRLLNFAYIVSHNLRSHSSNFQSILELYEIDGNKDDKTCYINMLHKVSENLNQSLHDLNEVVSINTNLNIVAAPIKVRDYLIKSIDVLSLQIDRKRGKIINDIPEEMVVNFNPAYMESILLNFITNALRYSHQERDPVIKISAEKISDKWIMEIRDNGIGIDLDKYGEKVFGLYQTFTSNAESRGVGLFISKNQIEAMGGEIKIESCINKGTIFKILFK